MREVLKIENLKKYYGVNSNITKAVNGISLNISESEFVAIMGASGSGKTTLLNCISTIDTVTSGHIYIDNKDITTVKEDDLADFRRENLGFIFQDFNLLDTLTIAENIALSLIINKDNINEVDNKVKSIASKLGISDILEKFPYEVSGGQKQRLILSRNLITNPNILIIDNGFTGLDIDTRKKVVDNLNNRNNKTTLVIISSMMEDIKNADKIYKLENKALVEMNMEEEVYDA